MNKNIYRVIFNAARGLWTVVQETATANGRGRSATISRREAASRAGWGFVDMLSMRHVAFAALCALGMQPLLVEAQVVAAPSSSGSKPLVGVSANGVPLVQIATPNAAGVSNNLYTQYNVGSQGLILNNSTGTVQTQQAGLVAGNPNLASSGAHVILNQVVGGSPSQLLGYTEVAGARAEVVIANPSGIYCNGCGFINTSRGILTTGTPVFGGTGSLDAFHVTGGQIQIGSAGLNGNNVDQVDLISRSVAINGKVWAGQSLNVVTGNNDVRYSDLSARSLGPDGSSPGVAIDVAQLGGMYAGKIRLVGTETGVGVNSAGTIASQSGDVTLSSQGKVTLSGTTSANGSVAISGAGEVSNAGSVYATQNASVSALGRVSNSGTVAALGNTNVTGASIDTSGALGAGIDANGNIAGTGSLAVSSVGAVSATGRQMAGGNLTLAGSSLNMAGAQTLARGGVALTATAAGGDTGNIDHAGASLQAGGGLTVSAAGALTNDQGRASAAQLGVTAGSVSNRGGTLSQTGADDTVIVAAGGFDNTGGTVATNAQNATLRAGSLTNASGQISQAGAGALNVRTGALDNTHGSVATNGAASIEATSLANGSGSITSGRTLDVASRGDIDNTAGRLEAAGTLNVSGANVQNAAGRIVSENGDGLSLTASGWIASAAGTTAQGATGGVIGGNGDATIQAASLTNSGSVTAGLTLDVATAGALDNRGGGMSAAVLTANAASLANANGAISANAVTLTVPQLDNSGGQITANQLSLSATNLTNEHGSLTQLGSGAMSVGVSGTLDNANGGVIQTNSTDLTLAPAALNNNGGTITHAGTGILTIDADSGAGTVTNVGGSIVSNGATMLSAAGVDNTGGTISAQAGLAATVTGALNNTRGRLASNANLSVSSGGALTNASGTIVATGNGALQATTLTNSGSITAGQDLHTAVTGTLDNSGGTLSAQTVTTAAASFKNTSGIVSGNTLSLTIPQLDNGDGQIIANQLSLSAANLTNEHGTLTQLGTGAISLGVSGTLDNSLGGVIQTNSTDLTLAPATLNNNGGTITHAGTGTLTIDAAGGTGAVTNVAGSIVSNGLTTLSSGSLDNTGGAISGQTGLVASVSGTLNNTRGQLASNADLSVSSGGALTNASGVIAATGEGSVQAAALTNSGSITAGQNLEATVAGMLDNSGGTLSGQIVTSAAASFKNAGGTVSGNALSLTAAQFDNSNGRIIANQLGLTSTNLTNAHGALTQLGSGAIRVNVSGVFDNSNGGVLQTNSTDLTLAPATLDNDGGTITHAGTGTLTIAPSNGAGSFTNVGGRIVSNGRASVLVGSFDNTAGVLASQGVLSAVVQSVLNNTNGQLSSGTALSASSGGALRNAGGIIGAGGAVAGSTLSLSASSIDNSGGAITNAGSGAMTINGGSQITNTNTGNVTGMGSISGNGDVTLNATSVVNTQGGQLSGANLQIATGNLNNSGGAIGNVANMTGDVGIATSSLTGTSGWINASRNLSITTSTLSGGGSYSAVGDLTLNLQGSFATSPNYSFGAGHNLTFTLPGTFSNGGRLAAAGGLNINASDVVNSGTLAAGGLLSTHSNTLTNTGAIVGGSVSLNATQTLSNLGTSALIGATDSAGKLELLAPDIENRDDTTAFDAQAMTAIYGLGQVVLAGGKDANGNYTNAGLVRNQSGLIQSGGDMLIAANQVTNTRRTMSTTGFTSSVDPNLLATLGISLSGCVAVHMEACSGQNVGWVYPSDVDPSQIGGVYTDPPHGGQWNSGYQYTTYTGVALANTVASISPQSQIIAGGNLNASSVGTFQNYWSQVAAAGNIAMPAALDQDSWRGQSAPQVQVTYSGEYHYNNYDNSEHNWQLPFGDAPFVGSQPGGYTQAAPADVRTYALPGYESSFTAGGTLSGTGVTLNNTAGNAGVTPLGLLPGQSVSGVGAGSVGGTISAGFSGRAVGAGRVSGAIASTGGLPASTVAVHGGQVANSGLANFNDPVIASATAVTVLNNIAVPQGGLFKRDTAPNATYLIETNPAFTNQQQWLSSDYYFQQMGMDPGRLQLRLGDGFYEQKLVQDQIMSMTGKAVLTNYASTQDEFKSLMTSGAELARSLDLAPGTGLSPQQVSQLTSNVVIMQSQIVDGERVLVPVVYLAKASQENMGNGPVIAATDIDLQNAKSVTNSGTIKAANNFSISAQTIESSFGTLKAGGQMSLVTAGDVNLTSATVKAGSLALQAGGNLVLDTAVKTLNQVSDTGATRVSSTLGPTASIDVVGNAAIVTGGNFVQNAGNLSVGGALGMNIGGNWTLGVQETGETKVVARANGVSDTHVVGDTGSSVKVGGVSAIAVGGDLTATGASINLGGGGTVAAGGNVTLQAAKATSTVDSNSSGSDHHGSYAETLHTLDDKLTGTTLQSGDSLAIVAGKDIAVNGSAVSLDKGNATLAAAGNVEIGAVTETHELNSHETHSHSGVASSTSVASALNTTTTLSEGSTISADGVSIASGKDINVKGSTIVGTNDVSLSAAHDVNITTSQDTMRSSSSYEEHHSGLMAGGGIAVSVGSSKLAQTEQESSVTNNASTIGSLNGNLTVQAGNNLHITGSDLIAAQNLTGTAANVIIDAATDTSHQAQTQQTSKSGVTLGLSGSVGDAINSAINETQAARNSARSGNDRAAALHSIAAAGDVASGIMGARAMANGATGPNAPSIGIQVSVGSSHSSSQSSEDQTTLRGSSMQAGGTATFIATGNGSPGSGNVTIAGSDVKAMDVALIAKNQVNLLNTTNTDSTRSSNSSSSASVGVSFGTNGWGISASMQNAHGDGNSDAAMQNNTHINASNSATILSGGDTNIVGASVNANQVVANIGGNLNIASVQDTTVSAAHQSSAGGGFSVSMAGGASASFSAQKGHADANYAGVNEQAGIQAGSGGFDITVKGNTDLKGAVIGSTADASKNSLTTATLTYSDIQDHSHYSASSGGFSAAISSPGGPNGVTPMMSQSANGDESATTRSAVSPGTINVTDAANQKQDVTSLSRDTNNANGTVSKTPDMQTILSQQADTMQAAQAAGQTIAKAIGDYASSKQKDAQAKADAAKAAGDTTAAAQYQAQADSWAEGGSNRILLHTVGGAALAGLGGGNIVGGAAGAALSSALAPKLNSIASAIGDETGSRALGNVLSNVLSGAAGALVGGSSGAFTASNADLYNRQLHPDEYALAQKYAKVVAQQLGISEEEAEGRIAAELMRNVDGQTALADGGVHDYKLRSILGCQMLECNASSTDPNYWNHGYNAQYIPSNGVTYTLGMSQGLVGQTYGDLVASNVKNNPVSTAIAGAGITGLGIAMGGLPSAGLATAGTVIGSGANAAIQYALTKQVGWNDVALAGVTGGFGAGLGYIPALLINTGGSLFGSSLSGQNPNTGMIGSVVGTTLGYPVGSLVEGATGGRINPLYRPQWKDIGLGISAPVSPSALPSWFGMTGSSLVQEITGQPTTNQLNKPK